MSKKWAPVLGLMALLLAIPIFTQGYWLRLCTSVLMYGVMAQSVNIISGYAGYPALGNAVFFGVGAYAVAVLFQVSNLPFLIVLLIGGIFCALYALIVGISILRLRGRYFLMATIALLELSKEITVNLGITGGARGLTLPVLHSTPQYGSVYFYYLMFSILIICTFSVYLISKSRFGAALQAIKFDEDAAGVMGINTVFYKSIAWALSALFTGLAGGVFAFWLNYIEPPIVYDIAMTVKMYLMFSFGGAATLFGPLIGALFVEVISELVWAKFLEVHYLILGSVMILSVLLMPRGIVGLIHSISQNSKFKTYTTSLSSLLKTRRCGKLARNTKNNQSR